MKMDRQYIISSVNIAPIGDRMKSFVVYTHSCPKTKKVLYVGSGSLKRANDITKREYRNTSPIIRIVKEFSDRNEAYKLEEKLTRDLKISGDATHNKRYGLKWDEESRSMLSKIHTGKKLTKKWKENIRISHLGSKNHFYGKTHTDETRKLISDRLKILNRTPPMLGKKHSKSSRKKMSMSQLASMTPDRRMKMSIAKMGVRPANARHVLCETNGVVYESCASAAIMTGCTKSRVSDVCRGVYSNTKNMVFKYIKESK